MNDLERITATLEYLADTGVDITPLVYTRFFALCPEAEALFASPEARTAQGKMINELVQTVLDQLEAKPYGKTVLETMVTDHDSWGATLPMYDAFLAAFISVLEEVLDEHATDEVMAAWQRQLSMVREQVAMALLRHAR